MKNVMKRERGEKSGKGRERDGLRMKIGSTGKERKGKGRKGAEKAKYRKRMAGERRKKK